MKSNANGFFDDKSKKLFIVLGGFFIANALVAEFIGVKIFSVEHTLGIPPFHISLFGVNDLSFNMTAGVIQWPFVFVMTDIINEYYGQKGVRFLSYIAAALIAYSFLMVNMAIHLQPADFWPNSHINPALPLSEQESIRQQVGDYNTAFKIVYSQSSWIILGSITAFLFGQLVDVVIFHKIKKITGENAIWLRSTGSTLISQFFDSFIVLFIAFYIGAGWTIERVLALGLVAYLYKFVVAILMTPVIYVVHFVIEKYLGHDLAATMKAESAK
ncbi:MAG: queuosine precursor transporter [Saprospiraceae bacterium]